jgi:hypothetical protein
MSSTLAHYQGPASLPSDYALLSRYAGNYLEEQDKRLDSDDELTDNDYAPQRPSSTSILRRASAPAPPRLRPQHSIGGIPSHPHHFSHIPIPGPIPSENTPLLNPPVPRIDESLERTSDDGSKMLIFWEELRILTRYALPVFTFVLVRFFYTVAVLTLHWQHSRIRVQYHHGVCCFDRPFVYHCSCWYHFGFNVRKRFRLQYHPRCHECSGHNASFCMDVFSTSIGRALGPTYECVHGAHLTSSMLILHHGTFSCCYGRIISGKNANSLHCLSSKGPHR